VDVGVLNESLEFLRGEVLIPRDSGDNVFNYLPLLPPMSESTDGFEFYGFRRVSDVRPMAGLDSSVVPIAESRDGFVLGVKGAIVYDYGLGYEAISVGPMPLYISLKLIDFYSSRFGLSPNFVRRAALDIGYAKRLSIDIFENILLERTFSRYRDLIILLDGSLIGPVKYRNLIRNSLLMRARDRVVSVVGISKRSKLLKKYPYLYGIVVSKGVPGALKVPPVVFKRRLGGVNVFIARFNPLGIPFRVDICDYEDFQRVLDEIYSSKLGDSGYPEVLKEAHILSKFSWSEVIVLRRFLESIGAEFRQAFRLRDVLFGAYNKSSGMGDGVEGI
jgi:hypothetical protein